MACAVILAAGESRRMGTPKQLLPFGRSSMLETVITTFLESRAERVFVVLGYARDEIEPTIRHLPVEIVHNPGYKRGMLSSVQAGIKAASGKCKAVIVALADQPTIPVRVVDRLIVSFEETDKGIVLPTYGGRRGHPVVIDLRYSGEIMDLADETGLRGLLHAHPGDILEVPVESPEILADIDDPETYRRKLLQDE